jgi:hypothetical protein
MVIPWGYYGDFYVLLAGWALIYLQRMPDLEESGG